MADGRVGFLREARCRVRGSSREVGMDSSHVEHHAAKCSMVVKDRDMLEIL